MTASVPYAIAFYLTAALAVFAGFMVVWHRHPVLNALYLVLTLFCTAVIFVLLQAHFLAAIQVLVYAGAVLVLFLMIIMLINQDPTELAKARPSLGKAVGLAAAFGVAVILITNMLPGYRSIHLLGNVEPEQVVLFLLERGASPADFKIKINRQRLSEQYMAGGENGKNAFMKGVAEQLLYESLADDAKTMINWPEKFEDMSSAQLNDISRELMNSIQALGPKEGLEEIETPDNMMWLFRMDEDPKGHVMAYIDAVARGRAMLFEEFGTTRSVGEILFARYILPFEAASIILLAAIVGVMVLARREKGESR